MVQLSGRADPARVSTLRGLGDKITVELLLANVFDMPDEFGQMRGP